MTSSHSPKCSQGLLAIKSRIPFSRTSQDLGRFMSRSDLRFESPFSNRLSFIDHRPSAIETIVLKTFDQFGYQWSENSFYNQKTFDGHVRASAGVLSNPSFFSTRNSLTKALTIDLIPNETKINHQKSAYI